MPTREFVEKLVSNLNKVDSPEIERVLRRLVQQKHFFEIVLANMAEGILVTDPQLTLVYLNPRAHEMLTPHSRRPLEGKSLLSVAKGELFEFLARKEFDPSKTTTGEVILEEPEPAICSISVYPILDDRSRRLVSLLMILRDISDIRREEAQRKQIEKLSSLSALTAGVAHDIRNPLNALHIHVQMLKAMLNNAKGEANKIDVPRLEKSVDVVEEEIKRLDKIIERFLSAVRPTRPVMELASINDLIRQTMETLRPEFEAAMTELKSELDPELPRIPVDIEQLKRAIFNVIKNAGESIDPKLGGSVTVRTWFNDSGVHIEVEDTGSGIARENLGLIFEPYYTTKFGGTGLGLMNVYRIVDEHHGNIHVDSEIGRGTIFTISLPLITKPVKLLEEN